MIDIIPNGIDSGCDTAMGVHGVIVANKQEVASLPIGMISSDILDCRLEKARARLAHSEIGTGVDLFEIMQYAVMCQMRLCCAGGENRIG